MYEAAFGQVTESKSMVAFVLQLRGILFDQRHRQRTRTPARWSGGASHVRKKKMWYEEV